MNLKTLIQDELWQAISKSYESGNYKNAITDATQYLTGLLREKTALDLDGIKLVGEAFGGDTPRIRINKFQTTSEKDEQRGFLQLLNGIYTAIRNPRSHERKEDTKNTADPIIYFIDYLCIVIDKSKTSFMIEEFLDRVFDHLFVANKRYAELLVSEIPSAKKTDVLIEIFRNRLRGTHENMKYITDEITANLTEADLEVFMQAFSDELSNWSEQHEISSAIEFIPSSYWSKVKETTKMRIENILIQSIRVGSCDPVTNEVYDGFLGIWATGVVRYFTLASEVKDVFINKIFSHNADEDAYVMKYFLYDLPVILNDKRSMMIAVKSIHRLVEAGNSGIRLRLVNFLNTCPSDWKNEILRQFEDVTDRQKPEFLLGDLTPFLGKLPKEDDDLPF